MSHRSPDPLLPLNKTQNTHLLGKDEGILHEVLHRCVGGHVVEGVDSVECLVHWVADHSGGKVVEADHISHHLGLRVLRD